MHELAFPLLVGLIILALAFYFLNGLHDAANSIATVVATRLLGPVQAVGFAAFARAEADPLFVEALDEDAEAVAVVVFAACDSSLALAAAFLRSRSRSLASAFSRSASRSAFCALRSFARRRTSSRAFSAA